MKRLLVIAVIVFFAAGAVAVYAGEGCKIDTKPVTSMFQKAADHINCHKPETSKKVEVFQDMSNGIKEGSTKARCESLRVKKDTVK